MGAIEMNCAGLPVVTLGKMVIRYNENELRDTYAISYKGIADKIVFLLTHDEVNERLGNSSKRAGEPIFSKKYYALWF